MSEDIPVTKLKRGSGRPQIPPQKETTKYSQTLNLPQTDFPMRADLPIREPQFLELWNQLGIYQKLKMRENKFILHDGPPYANGSIHIGHALNKILKDMVMKSRALKGLGTPYVPGWDCHGLPIEAALLKEKKMSQRGIKDVPAFRKEAAAFAERFIGIQREDFKRLGVLADWENPYRTMDKAYEAEVIGVFSKLWKKNYIYRGLKPVYWCISCETALAEAEIEYKDKTSPSVYVAFRIKEGPKELIGKDVLVWTTTPWTLPANMAVAFNPDERYRVITVERPEGNRHILHAINRLRPLELLFQASKYGADATSYTGKDLVDAKLTCETPFGERRSIAVAADYVTMEDGTGIVHTAPGHGADDFKTGQAYGLETFCPVDSAGRFNESAPEFLRGQKVFPEGNALVIEDLKKRGALLYQENIQHSYPHCWRCKNPVIFRATEQWFLSLDQKIGNPLRSALLHEVEKVSWIPEAGKNRIAGMISSRPDWCLSRQRLWGTPIPVLYCAQCKIPLKDGAVLEVLENQVREQGDDFWFENWEALVNRKLWPFLPENLKCTCGSLDFIREKDILDVWMDSGVSWASVLKEGEFPADLYLEGSDQHRGWFQSSLVASVGVNDHAPYEKVLTHGFVLDEKGRAMHKSAGNVVSPQEIIQKYGADILRLWVALSDYAEDIRISDKILAGPIEGYRKIRNTLRYLLGNTFDFNPTPNDAFKEPAPELEIYMMGLLENLQKEVLSDYDKFQFRAAIRKIIDFCAFDLSAFYCDILKDRLYTFPKNHPERRAAQTVMAECLTSLCALLSPILPFTMEEAWQEGPMRWGQGESVLLHVLKDSADFSINPVLLKRFDQIREIRAAAQKKLEESRAAGIIGSSLEAKVLLTGKIPDSVLNWPELLIVSQVETSKAEHDLQIEVLKADGVKCPRCWRYQTNAGSSLTHPELCARCAHNLDRA